MANIRPAGYSDSSDSDSDYGLIEKPKKNFYTGGYGDCTKKQDEVALQDAIINANIGDVEKIINQKFNGNVNTRLESGWTPLMHSCFHAQDKIVEYLLNNGADPNLHSDSVTPIMAACSNSSANNDAIFHIVDKLIEKNCVLNVGDKYGQTPLMRAIASGRVAVVQKILEKDVNIEMRDQQGWTATFWAVHHNQPEILEMLIECNARLYEVDRANRTLLDIAQSHDYQSIIEVLNTHIKSEEKVDEDADIINSKIASWQDFYPGITEGEKPNYSSEIQHLLYGMNCERLSPLMYKHNVDLRTFLLMEEQDMVKLGIDLPFEKQRLKNGIRNFHIRQWKLESVSGLYARKAENYSVLDCLTSLGTHLQQMYILEATLQYTLREYYKLQNKFKFEPPSSPTIIQLKGEVKKMKDNIFKIRKELMKFKILLTKISKKNPPPADLIKGVSTQEVAFNIVSKVIIVASLSYLVYHSRNSIYSLFKK